VDEEIPPEQPTQRLPEPAAPATDGLPEEGISKASRQGRNLKVAAAAGLTLGALALATIFLGRGPFFAFAIVMILLAELEFYFAVRRGGYDPAIALGMIAGGVLMVGAYFRGETAIPLVLFMSLLFTFIWYMTGGTTSNIVNSIGVSVLGVAYAPLLGAFAGLMLRRGDGRGVVLATIGAAVFYDVFAYAGGSRWGKHPLAPSISPKKTVEGAAIATVAILLLGTFIAPQMGPWNYPQAFVFAALVCLFAPIGDLIESRMKRDLGIKDMGALIPGHGGSLDRLDAILFSAPAAYLSLRIFGL
jgi:phosphatidate cytidylyltransferase